MVAFKSERIRSIFQTLEDDGGFTILVRGIRVADMEERLRKGWPYTFFAPSDEAFRSIPQDVLDDFMGDRGKMAAFIKYHLVDGRLRSNDLEDGQALRSVRGEDLFVGTKGGFSINHARVVRPDQECTNGFLHVVDRVLIPNLRTVYR